MIVFVFLYIDNFSVMVVWMMVFCYFSGVVRVWFQLCQQVVVFCLKLWVVLLMLLCRVLFGLRMKLQGWLIMKVVLLMMQLMGVLVLRCRVCFWLIQWMWLLLCVCGGILWFQLNLGCSIMCMCGVFESGWMWCISCSGWKKCFWFWKCGVRLVILMFWFNVLYRWVCSMVVLGLYYCLLWEKFFSWKVYSVLLLVGLSRVLKIGLLLKCGRQYQMMWFILFIKVEKV